MNEIYEIHEIYDRALSDWLKVTLEGETEPIKMAFAVGSRGFQRLEYLYNQERRVNYPIMALLRTDSTIADDRFRYNPRIVVNHEEVGNTFISKTAFCPQPIDIPYTLDIRSVKRNTMNEIIVKLLHKFIKDLGYIKVDLGVYGIKYLSVKLDGVSDNSELEPGEEEKKVRYTATFQLRGWVLRPTEEKKIVRNFRSEIYNALVTPEELLSSVEIHN